MESYVNLGDTPVETISRAAKRIRAIRADIESLAVAPHQGTLLDKTAPGLRNATKNRTIFCFQVGEEQQTIRVLAVFFGGQDHGRHILERLDRAT